MQLESSTSFTCLSALAASFLDNRNDPPFEDRLFNDFLEIRSDWLLSKLKELFGEEDAEEFSPAPAAGGLWRSDSSNDLGGDPLLCNDVSETNQL